MVKVRAGRRWELASKHINAFDSMFSQVADMSKAPEIYRMRETIRSWRFYDSFRTDGDAPACMAQLGTRTPVLHHDGRDLIAALNEHPECRSIQLEKDLGQTRIIDQDLQDEPLWHWPD